MESLLETLKHWVKLTPHKEFVVDGERRLTYEEVYENSLRLAGGLKSVGIAKGARAANMMFNSAYYYDLYYGLSAAGCVIVPLNFRLSDQELIYQINDCEAEALFFDPEFEETVLRIKDSLNSVRHLICTHGEPPFTGASKYNDLLTKEPHETKVGENDLFGIYYTGGTTGLAKGVMLTHKNIIANAVNSALTAGMEGNHIVLHAAPMFHLADGAINFAVTMLGGSHVTIKAFDPVAFMGAIQSEGVTSALLVPTMINILINHPDVHKYDLSSLELLFYGASPISPEVLQRAMDLLGCSFVQAYGMTEAAPILTFLLPEDHKNPQFLSSAGRQLIGVDVRVVDEDGRDVPPGEVGEVIARGPNIMKGYWNKPAETEEALRDGWYWTKDMAKIDEDNYIYIVDRAKDMIVSGGENIYSVEVEAALYKHPAVLEVAVIGVPDEKWGEAVKAIVVLKPGAAAEEKELIGFCKKHIASYKAPKSIGFLRELPKSGAGKILKRTLRERHWQDKSRRVG